MTRSSRLRRILLVVLAGMLGLGVALWAGGWLASPAGNEWLRRRGVDVANAFLAEGHLSVDRLDTNLLNRVTLEGVHLRAADGHTVVAVARIDLRFRLWPLLRRRVHVVRLILDHPDIDVRMGPDGRLDLARIFGVSSSTGPSSGWSGTPLFVRIDRIEVTGGAFRYRASDRTIACRAVLLSTALVARHRLVRLGPMRVEARCDAPLPDRILVSGVLRYRQTDLLLQNLLVRTRASGVRVTGRIGTFQADPAFDLAVDAEPIGKSDVERIVGSKVLGSDLAVHGKVVGKASALSVTSTITVRGGPALGQSLGLSASGDLTGKPPTWLATATTDRFDLDRVLSGLERPVRLAGSYKAQGAGFDWPEHLTADVALTGRTQVIWGEPLDDLELRAHVERGGLRVSRLAARHPLGRVEATGSVDLVRRKLRMRARLWSGDLGALSRYGLEAIAGRASTDLAVRVDWSGPAVRVGAEGVISAENLEVPGGARIASLDGPIAVSLSGGVLDASGQAEARGLSGSAVGLERAKLDWKVRGSSVEGWSARVDYRGGSAALGDQVTVKAVEGAVRVQVPRGGAVKVEAAAKLQGMVLPETGYAVTSGSASVDLEGDRLSTRLELAGPPGRPKVLRAEATGDLATGNWVVTKFAAAPLEGVELHAVGPVKMRLGPQGVEGLDLTVGGTVGTLSAAGALTDARVDFEAHAKDVVLAQVTRLVGLFVPPSEPGGPPPMQGMSGAVTLDLAVREQSEGRTVRGQVAVADLVVPGAIDGVSGTLALGGTLSLPTVHLRLRDAATRTLLGAGVATVPLRWHGLDLRGVDCSGQVELRTILAPIGLAAMEERVPVLHDLPPGEASLDIRMDGDACDPDVAAVVAASGALGLHGEEVRLDARLERKGETLALMAHATERQARRIELRGTATTRMGEVFKRLLEGGRVPDLARPSTWVSDLDIALAPLNMPVEVLSTFVDMHETARGRVGGGFRFHGSATDAELTGGLVCIQCGVGDIDLAPVNYSQVPEDGGYRVELSVPVQGGGSLGASGFVPMAFNIDEPLAKQLEHAGLDVDIEAHNLPLELVLAPVREVSRVEGTIEARVKLAGTLGSPAIRGVASLAGAAFDLPAAGVRYSDIDAELLLAGDRISVGRLDITDAPLAQGSLRRTGRLRLKPGRDHQLVILKGYRPSSIDLDLGLEDFWLSATEEAVLQVDGDATVGGAWPELKIGGNLSLVQGRLDLGQEVFLGETELALDPSIHIVGRTARGPVAEVPPLWYRFDIGLNLDLVRRMELQADMPLTSSYGRLGAAFTTISTDARLDGRVRLLFDRGEPDIEGTIETVRGTVSAFGASFDLSEGGKVSFVTADYHEPLLDIEAVHHAGEYGDITMKVTGMPGDLSLAFSSSDYLDQTDMFSILLTGRPASEIGEGGAQDLSLLSLLVSSEAARLSRAVTSGLLGTVRLSGEAARLSVPLSDRVFATYEFNWTATQYENLNQILLEWYMGHRILGDLVFGDRSVMSAEAFWRWRF